ncbi:MAG: hypothetical protein ACJ75B_15190 [Flavisolibacter sp.]
MVYFPINNDRVGFTHKYFQNPAAFVSGIYKLAVDWFKTKILN